MDRITLIEPIDAHVHFREHERMRSVAPLTARQFTAAVVMPNTNPFILNTDDACRYQDEILEATRGFNFIPLMTLYLTPQLSPDEIRRAKRSGRVVGVKFYPRGQTTNSHGGVRDWGEVQDQLAAMEKEGLPLLIHGEVADDTVDVFEREAQFYRTLQAVLDAYPRLRVVCEHITTEQAVEFVKRQSKHRWMGATITPQHALVNRNYMLGGMLRPHAYCKPILKGETDRLAIFYAMTSGNPRFFLGTDSAPHAQHGTPGKAKEVDCGCAGCFSAHAALELYAEGFDRAGHLDRLQDFAGTFARNFYEIGYKGGREVTLARESWQAPESYDFGDGRVVPFRQEVPLSWKMVA